jgi:hypothetical protein
MKKYFHLYILLLFSCENRGEDYVENTSTVRRFNEIKSLFRMTNKNDYPALVNELQNGTMESFKRFAQNKPAEFYTFTDSPSNFMLDGWGERVAITTSDDYSLIIICSYGSNLKFDHYSGDDLITVLENDT